MSMISADSVTPRAIRSIMPESFKTKAYTKLSEGMEITIDSVAFSVYPARNKETKEVLMRRDGSVVTKVTAYIGFGNLYSTVSNEIAVGQLMSITGDFDMNEPNVYEYPNVEPCRVKVVTKDMKYGTKSFPSWVFIPIERYKQMDITTGIFHSIPKR